MKVIVCGAGIAGLAVAQRLDSHGAEVTVLEKAPGPRTAGYMVDLTRDQIIGFGVRVATQRG